MKTSMSGARIAFWFECFAIGLLLAVVSYVGGRVLGYVWNLL